MHDWQDYLGQLSNDTGLRQDRFEKTSRLIECQDGVNTDAENQQFPDTSHFSFYIFCNLTSCTCSYLRLIWYSLHDNTPLINL